MFEVTKSAILIGLVAARQPRFSIRNLDMVKILLSHGANINAAAPELFNGRTALQGAAEGGHLKIVALLLETGANVNALGGKYRGRKAIQAAAEGEHLDIAKLLLDKQASVNAPPCIDGGTTVLHAAGGSEDLNMVRVLVDHQAHGHLDVLNVLLNTLSNRSYLGGIYSPLSQVVHQRNVEMMKLILDHGAILTPTVADKTINGGLDDLIGQYLQSRTRALEMEPRVVD